MFGQVEEEEEGGLSRVHRPVNFRTVWLERWGGAAERKSGGNMEVENITNKHNVWTETVECGSWGGERSDEVLILIYKCVCVCVYVCALNNTSTIIFW